MSEAATAPGEGPPTDQAGDDAPADVLAVGAHPDDIELGCGALIARLVAEGRTVDLCHLTRGERGTRGSAAERTREAERAAEVLGVRRLEFLDCGDGGLRTGPAEEDALIEVVRRSRPHLMLVPPPSDRHPDHERAHRLAFESAFYAGLRNRAPELGSAHRPAAVFWYMLHQPFEPTLLVDVAEHFEAKLRALESYASQFSPREPEPLSSPQGAEESARNTHVSSCAFWNGIEGRARHYGQQIGVEFAEPLGCRLPFAIHDTAQLLSTRRP